MRSLFLRIFLWFWAAMVAVVTLLVVSSPFFTRSHPGVDRWQQSASQALSERVAHVAREIATGSVRESRSEVLRRRHRAPVHLFVFDADGTELRGQEAGREARELAQRAAAAGESVSERMGSVHLEGLPVTDVDGNLRVVVGMMRRPPQPIDLLDPRVLIPRLAALTLVVGLFCLLLARHLSSPVAALRAATRGLAEGDLGARVGPPVARRSDEIGDLARDFDGMAERLEQQVEAQRRLLRDVSHELRSPLARLEVALELARRRAGEGATEPLERIGRESRRLDGLVEQLLTLERLDSESGSAGRQDIDLAQVLEDVVADARFEAEARGCDVTLEIETRPTLRGHPELLRSALENVVRNAVAHTEPDRGVEARVEELAVQGGSMAVVSVRDHGRGVPSDRLHRLFEPFYRVEDDRDRRTGGVGLGLAITERAVRVHRGVVEARNHPDGGLEVTITLPIA